MSDVKNVPDGWMETTLGEVAEKMYSGGTPLTNRDDYYGGTIPWIRTQEVVFNFIKEAEIKITELGLKNSSARFIPLDTVIVAMYGNSAGRVALSKIEATTNQACCNIISNPKKSNAYFIFYNLLGRYKEIEGKANGAAQQNLSVGVLKELEIKLPTLIEQKSIADILIAFDNKIELLLDQNKTLEETAQTIFTEWFGKYKTDDELPKGWRVGTIGELTEIKRGGSPRPIQDYISDSGYRWLKISDATATISPYIFEIKEHIKVEGLNKTTLKKAGDLVLSNSATPGMPKFLAVDTCVHDGWMHFPSSKVSNEYLYLLFLHIRPALVQQGSGSVFVNLKTDILRYFETVIPSNYALNKFDDLIKPFFDKILGNAEQIQTLTKTRDQLLPRLMSGEVRVKM